MALQTVVDKKRRTKLILNMLTLIVASLSFFRSKPVSREVSPFSHIMIELMAPIQSSLKETKQKVSGLIDHYIFNIDASKENIELKKHLSSLEEKIFDLKELELENHRLKQLLARDRVDQSKRVLAQLVSWDASSDYQSFRIDVGTNDGLRLQDPVVTSQGLVGFIYRLTDNFADVLTILDNRNRVDSLVQRTRSFGIVEGAGGARCHMKYVSRTSPINLGDQVITSGLGNIYPKGLKVGVVSKVVREGIGIVQHIEIRPNVDFKNLEEVLVLVNPSVYEKRKEKEALNEMKASREDKGEF